MKNPEVKVTFQPSGRSVYVLPGTLLLEAAGRAGIILQTPCGGQGTCGKCRVRIISGDVTVRGGTPARPDAKPGAPEYHLACQTLVDGPLVVDIPDASRFENRPQILVGDSGTKGELKPVVRKVFFHLEPPAGGHPVSDLSRLRAAVGPCAVSPEWLLRLPGFLRSHGWQGTAVLGANRLMSLEAGHTEDKAYGVAMDLGTTTVVGTLFDLGSGQERGVVSRLNGQIVFGDDVISRIQRIRHNGGALAELQETIVDTLNDIITTLAAKAGIAEEHIYEVAIAGNTTMQQILCGIDPSALGEIPFAHAFDESQIWPAHRLNLRTNPAADLFVFPQIGGFIGGDTVAGMVAARLDQWEGPVLLIDIGTNGEIVLVHDGRIQATSTAAGPAFEGARIRQGMRATTGAIEKVMIREDLIVNVIGNAPPTGLCGTALIDAVAELLRLGVIDATGRIQTADEAPANLPDRIRRRLKTHADETHVVLVPAGETASGEAICLWQRDVRELQLATGAIRAGARLLLQRAGVEPEALSAVLLAGAFGNFIRRNNARRIGLLPPIPCSRIRFIGNAASLGAKLALLSADERTYANALRDRTEHVDLSRDPRFQEEFGLAMIFPDERPDDAEPC